MAVCLLYKAQESGDEQERRRSTEKAKALLTEIPKVTNRIAGKSIPIEARQLKIHV